MNISFPVSKEPAELLLKSEDVTKVMVTIPSLKDIN
jgi:hypothetical protein